MKKLATALVSAAAIMTMSTTAFAAENPAEVFDRVMEKNNTIQSAEIQSGVHSVILAKDVIPDGQMKVDMAMHAEMDMQDTTDLKYLAQVASSMADAQRFFQPIDRFIIQPVYLGHIFHFDRVLLCVLRLLCPCVCCIFSRHISFSFLLFHYSRSIACFLCFLQFLYAEKHTSFYVLTKNIRIFL